MSPKGKFKVKRTKPNMSRKGTAVRTSGRKQAKKYLKRVT